MSDIFIPKDRLWYKGFRGRVLEFITLLHYVTRNGYAMYVMYISCRSVEKLFALIHNRQEGVVIRFHHQGIEEFGDWIGSFF